MAATGDRAVLLAGGTGLVGGLALDRLLAPGGFERVVSLGRRPLLNPLLRSSLRRYRGVQADAVAAALVRAALDPAPGRFVWEYDAIVG